MNGSESRGSFRERLGLNTNSYISIGLAAMFLAGVIAVFSKIDAKGTEVIAASDAKYATRDALEAKWGSMNELVNARVTVLTERVAAVGTSLSELRSTVAGVPELTATMKDIQRQLDRIERDKK